MTFLGQPGTQIPDTVIRIRVYLLDSWIFFFNKNCDLVCVSCFDDSIYIEYIEIYFWCCGEEPNLSESRLKTTLDERLIKCLDVHTDNKSLL